MDSTELKDLKIHAAHVRKMALEAVHSAGAGHPEVRFRLLIFLHIYILRK